uniref:Uncharacterized protein n=1 Tax=Pithovirus LCPAC103 TaxID=2506588 RepID=A0A481Z3K6_9VIRU|nr:MAG: hypothetical protein LCPAC103_01590 [Pithovirus LCPAC103]
MTPKDPPLVNEDDIDRIVNEAVNELIRMMIFNLEQRLMTRLAEQQQPDVIDMPAVPPTMPAMPAVPPAVPPAIPAMPEVLKVVPAVPPAIPAIPAIPAMPAVPPAIPAMPEVLKVVPANSIIDTLTAADPEGTIEVTEPSKDITAKSISLNIAGLPAIIITIG